MEKSRYALPREARDMRQKAYANGHILTEEEKEKLYNEIKGIPGAEWYDRHKHSNFCTRFEREAASSARAEVRRRLALNSNPTVLEILKWSLEIEIPEHRVWKIVYELTRDELMAQAKLQNEIEQLLSST